MESSLCGFGFLLFCEGGLPLPALARPASPAFGGGLAFLLACQPRLWFSFLPPSPLPPFPSGEGGDFYFISPGAPPPAPRALDRLRHLQRLPSRCPAGGCSPCGTCSPCPGGEDHLKRRSSSPPVPPLLGCRRCSWEPVSTDFAVNHEFSPPADRVNLGTAIPYGKERRLQSI